MKDKYYNILIDLAIKASKNEDVPVSAIIVRKDKIIAKAYNKRYQKRNTLYHAEILAIAKACRKLHKWILDDCDMYVTLKPCSMCEGAINQARMKNVYYLLDKMPEKHEYNKTKFIKENKCMQEEQTKEILQDFFKNKRDKK